MSSVTASAQLDAPIEVGVALPLRVSGVGGLVFVSMLVIDNIIRAGAPGFGASATAISSYVGGHRAAMIVPIALFPVGMVALFCFVAGLWTIADREAPWWVRTGVLGAAAIAGFFSVVNLVEAALIASTSQIAGTPAVATILWRVSGSAFGLNLDAIGIALFALSRAARALQLIPGWLGGLAIPGALCLFIASVFTVGIAEGQAWLYLGLVGFLVWALFVVVTSVSLLRR